MSNLFDSLQHTAHSLVNQVMGVDASWGSQVARVLFNDPSKKYELAGIDFEPAGWSMEYKAGDFTGLKDSVDDGNSEEIIINSHTYYVRSIRTEFDGKTYIAQLEKQ